jgi:high-affinity iron transporter
MINQNRRAYLWATLLLAAITIVNAIHFLIYSIAYWSNEQADMSLIMGSIIGLGISLSVSILLHAIVNSVSYSLPKLIFLCVFCAGQFASITVLLEQVDFIDVTTTLWDSSSWVADDSEYGHLLNVLFGYEATPSTAYLAAYLIAVLLPIFSAFVFRKANNTKQHEAPSL